MSKIQCKRCDETKDAVEMVVRAGKPSKLCRACFADSFKKTKKGGDVRKTETTLAEKVTRRAKPAMPEKPNGALEIAQSYGCRAHWEDDYLHVEQDQVDDDGNAVLARLMLTRSDLQRLVEWAA